MARLTGFTSYAEARRHRGRSFASTSLDIVDCQHFHGDSSLLLQKQAFKAFLVF